MLEVKLMRKVDGIVGNAICSVLAAGKKLTRPFAQPVTTYRKICVMKFFGMGSIVVATPSLRAIRDQFPGAEIHFVTFKQNKELLEILNLTDHHHFVDNSSPQAFIASTLKVANDLRKAGIDLVIDLEFYAKFPLVLSSLGNIPKKAGFYLNPEPWRRELLDVPGWYNHYFHTKDIFLSLVYLLAKDDIYYLDFANFSAKYGYPRVTPADSTVATVRTKLAAHGAGKSGRIFVINPNTSPDLAPEARKWPAERYGELARKLLAEYPDAHVAFIGTKGEAPYVSAVKDTTGDPRAFSIAGELNLKELIALFSITDLLVSNDSGPMHLACLTDTPVVGLFFANTPTLFAPIGSKTAAVSPPLYSMPLFTVYNGKDIVVGRGAETIKNTAACAVTVAEVFDRTRPLIGPAPRANASVN
jgi:ADP-heptose:LPS heptosyltransferase